MRNKWTPERWFSQAWTRVNFNIHRSTEAITDGVETDCFLCVFCLSPASKHASNVMVEALLR